MSRAWWAVPGVALLTSFYACGGGGGSPTTPTPSPSPVERALVDVPSLSLAAGFGVLEPFSADRPGGIAVTVDWTRPENDVDVYLIVGACTSEQFLSGQCQVVTYSDSTTAKPEQLAVTRSSPNSYALFVVNNGPGDEQVAYQVVLVTAS